MFGLSSKKIKIATLISVPFLMLIPVFALYYMISMPGVSLAAPPPVLTSTEQQLVPRLKSHVDMIADRIGERHYQMQAELELTANYIATEFERSGYNVKRDIYGKSDSLFENIYVDTADAVNQSTLLVGAHYDSVWLSPGADDNASGVAVLLELARLLGNRTVNSNIRFVAFANEESPFFATEQMGSHVHVTRAIRRGEIITGMISLEMLGYYSSAADSQQYPKPLSYFYPDTGNFIAFVGNLQSAAWVKTGISIFRQRERFPAYGFVAPAMLFPDIRRSDQFAFWQQGIAAFMVTDTANYRNPHYHTYADSPETLNYEYMSQVTQSLAGMLVSLANATDQVRFSPVSR